MKLQVNKETIKFSGGIPPAGTAGIVDVIELRTVCGQICSRVALGRRYVLVDTEGPLSWIPEDRLRSWTKFVYKAETGIHFQQQTGENK